MEAVLSLLNHMVAAVVGLFIMLGSVFTGGSVTAVNMQPLATTSSTVATTSPQMATSTAATSTAAKQSSPKTRPGGSVPRTAPAGGGVKDLSQGDSAQPTPTPPPAASPYTVEQVNSMARSALVNIICTTQNGGTFNPISGSGVVIDSRGIILTNAHVAQYFLLRDYPTKDNIQCVVRIGSPAQPRYTAELLYLPPAWIAANASEIGSSSPTGTGQDDYAFVRITGTTDPNATLPATFPFLPMTIASPQSGQQVVLAAYPAGFLGGVSITLNLYQTSAVATIGQLFNFSGNSVDLVSLGGTVVSQGGSSGGAMVNASAQLQGLISNEIPADTTAGRDLRAITVGYIDRSLAAAGLGGILPLLAHDPAAYAATFNKTVAPQETKALKDNLN